MDMQNARSELRDPPRVRWLLILAESGLALFVSLALVQILAS